MPRALALLCCLCVAATGAAYVNDFSGAEVGKVPADFQVAAGEFAVVEGDGNKVLELAGEPLDTFGLLYGPSQPAEAAASARVQAESTGRRYPEFGIGVGDIGGYRLMLLPAQKKVQLRKGDDPVAAADLARPWSSGSWTHLRLVVRKVAEGRWKVEGKAWPGGQPEPQGVSISLEVTESPPAGRASLWGVPFSGKPIRFDDLTAAGG